MGRMPHRRPPGNLLDMELKPGHFKLCVKIAAEFSGASNDCAGVQFKLDMSL
jgi:hypothetical protein